jgi:DNA polymerase V
VPIHIQLPIATADTAKLAGAARRALAAIRRPGFSYKKAGVVFLDLVPAAEVTGGLFDAPDTPANRHLMRTLAGLNNRYGRDTVTYAAYGRRRAWKPRSDQLSRCCTACWDELLRVCLESVHQRASLRSNRIAEAA